MFAHECDRSVSLSRDLCFILTFPLDGLVLKRAQTAVRLWKKDIQRVEDREAIGSFVMLQQYPGNQISLNYQCPVSNAFGGGRTQL